MHKFGLVPAAIVAALLANPARAEEVVIGVQLPLTGPMASWTGPVMRDGIWIGQDQVEQLKLLGEGRTIRVIMGDNASDKTQSITLASKFCDADKVSLMIGPPTTVLAAPVAPVANQKDCPTIALNVGRESSSVGPWIFKAYDDPEKVMDGIARYVATQVRPKSIHMVTIRDNAAALAYRNAVMAIFQAAGQKGVTEDTILSSDVDFTALATKIADGEPEVLFITATPEASANIVIAARQAGLPASTKIVGADYFASPAFAQVGGAAVEGAIFPAHFSPERPDAVNADFVAAYKAKFGRDPDAYAAIAYNAFMMAVQALKTAGPQASRQQIRDALATTHAMPSVLGTGTVSIDADRSVVYDMLLVRNVQGRLVPVR